MQAPKRLQLPSARKKDAPRRWNSGMHAHAKFPCKMKGATKKMWLPGFEPESQHSCLHALASWAELLSRKNSTATIFIMGKDEKLTSN